MWKRLANAVYTLIPALIFLNYTVLAYAESLTIRGKAWRLDYSGQDPFHIINEYVPAGETVNNWSQLITKELLPAPAVTPREYVSRYIAMLDSKVPSGVHIHHRILKFDRQSVLFEWWINGPSNYAQHEYYKLVIKSGQSQIARYTTKRLSTVNRNRAFWIRYIERN